MVNAGTLSDVKVTRFDACVILKFPLKRSRRSWDRAGKDGETGHDSEKNAIVMTKFQENDPA